MDGSRDDDCESNCAAETTFDPRLAAISNDLHHWTSLGADGRESLLKDVEGLKCKISNEALVTICRAAFNEKDQRTLNLAARALSKAAMPLLKSATRMSSLEDRIDDIQNILTDLFQAIANGKSEFAEKYFAAFARKKAISAYRKRKGMFEGKNQQARPYDDPEESGDETHADEANEGSLELSASPSIDKIALLSKAFDALSPEWRAAFIQYHQFGLTQREIAEQHGKSERTVRNWLKCANKALGISGEVQ